MAIKKILTEPNKLLRQISQPVERVGDSERELMNDMLETMYAANGIGLAAIQIGIQKRIIVMDLSKEENKKIPMYYVNPKIQKKNEEKILNHFKTRDLALPSQFYFNPVM
jgi:peptide deformylase